MKDGSVLAVTRRVSTRPASEPEPLVEACADLLADFLLRQPDATNEHGDLDAAEVAAGASEACYTAPPEVRS